MNIRHALPEDREFLREALRESTPLQEQDIDTTLEKIYTEGLPNGDPVLVAEEEGVPVGCHICVINRDGMSYQIGRATGYCTYVIPSKRRQGISKQIRDRSLEILKEKGVPSTVGAVTVDNEAGLRSIYSQGFRLVAYVVAKEI